MTKLTTNSNTTHISAKNWNKTEAIKTKKMSNNIYCTRKLNKILSAWSTSNWVNSCATHPSLYCQKIKL